MIGLFSSLLHLYDLENACPVNTYYMHQWMFQSFQVVGHLYGQYIPSLEFQQWFEQFHPVTQKYLPNSGHMIPTISVHHLQTGLTVL